MHTLPSLRAHRGFTLFEVAISLGIVTFGVISVLMLIPTGIKAQQMSRYQILASVRAMELVDSFAQAADASLMLDREGPHPWDVATSYRAYAPDLEIRIGSFVHGLYPLPLEIARRLESEGDEIKRVLDEGGYLYYSQPSATGRFNPVAARSNMPAPNESQKILVAITGYAQQNAIPTLSYKAWPYHAPYPAPPMHVLNQHDMVTSISKTPWTVQHKSGNYNFVLWEDTLEADNGDMGIVFEGIVSGEGLPLVNAWVEACKDGGMLDGKNARKSCGYWSYGDRGGWIPYQGDSDSPDGLKTEDDKQPTKVHGVDNPIAKHPDTGEDVKNKDVAREAALAYFALAKWYAQRKGVSTNILNGVPLADNQDLLKPSTLFASNTGNQALAINAARILAHAAMCVTRHFKPDGAPDETISIGPLTIEREKDKPIKGNLEYKGTSPAFTINRTMALNYVDNAMKLGMRFSACYPYDWGSPRVLNRATMMDFPLLQYDPFDPGRITPSTKYFSGYNYGVRPANGSIPAKGPEQWKIISAQPITNIGRSMCYPTMDLTELWPNVTSTTPNHFTLARPFDVADRTRQMIFWAVDWQSYVDFETAPSAPVDASRYPKESPHGKNLGNNAAKIVNTRDKYEFADRHQLNARNPEKTLVYLEPTIDKPTGSEIQIGSVDVAQKGYRLFMDKYPVVKPPYAPAGMNPDHILTGQYGADRNFNGTKETKNGADIITIWGKLDRGTVPASVRLRASLVGRFNFYDPRLPLVVR